MTTTYKIDPMICVDKKGYVLALVDWRGDICVRRRRLSPSDTLRLWKWIGSLPLKDAVSTKQWEETFCLPATP